ncbi:MAG: replication initiator protein A [Lachnospiraceae bacterium]|nr:replication initiator protein A [Lachnospiraceae bacterium]
MEIQGVMIPESTYIHSNEADQFIYIQVPLDLIVADCFAGLSGEAKILYGMLLNRTGLSVRNGWEDENGRVFINYTIEDVMKDMHVKHCMASKLFSELTKIRQIGEENGKPVWFGLIEKVRVLNKPSRIYVHKVSEVKKYLETMDRNSTETFGQIDQRLEEKTPESPKTLVVYSDRRRSSTGVDDGHLQEQTTVICEDRRRTSAAVDENKKNKINIDPRDHEWRNKNQSILSSPVEEKAREPDGWDVMDEMCYVRQKIRANVEYDTFFQGLKYDEKDKLDELIEVMVEAIVNMGDITINGKLIPHSLIVRRFMDIDLYKIQYVMDSLKNTTKMVKNSLKFLIATLYNASLTMENHRSLEVQHDLSIPDGLYDG